MKKKLTFSKLVMLVIMAVLPFSMYAQEGKKKSKPVERYWYIQADGGLSINHGDLANYNGGVWDDFDHFKTLAFQNFTENWNAHLGIGYQFGKVVGMNLKGGYGLLSGHKHEVENGDPTLQTLGFINGPLGNYTNLGFDGTSYIEGNLNLTFNLFNMFKYNPRRVINLVPHIGIGGIYYKAGDVYQLNYDQANNVDEALGGAIKPKADGREFALSVPAGMEFTFNLAPKFDLFIDYTYNFTNTDNLDQVRKQKWDPNSTAFVEEDRIINNMDMYSQLNLGLRFKFNNPCDIDKMARESKKITYRVNPDPLVEGEDGNVCFDVIVTIPGEYFEKQAVMNLKPYLAYNGGQIDLDPITFVGEKVKGQGDFRVNYKEGGEFTKHYCMPYQPEMENCELMGDPMFYVYDGTIYPTQDEIVKNAYYATGATEKLADGVVPRPCDPVAKLTKEVTEDGIIVTWSGDAESYDIIITKDGKEMVQKNVKETTYTYNYEEAGNYNIQVIANCEGGKKAKPQIISAEVKPSKVEPDFIYYFDYNKSNIPGAGRDVRDRNKIAKKQVKELVTGDVKGLRIEGWASPENGMGTNTQLSKDRAVAAIADIKAICKKNAKNIEFNDNGNGSDWDTFKKLVQNSNIKDKDAILNKINNSSNKEEEIQQLKLVYPELERDILPLIRRAEVYIIK